MAPLGMAWMDIEALEPQCSCCSSKIDYDVTTRFDDKRQTHVCLGCGTPV